MRFFFPLFLILIFISCQEQKKNEVQKIDESKLKLRIEEVQKPSISMEDDIINSYVKQHNLTMQTSGSGLRYKISGEESDLERISPGDWVDVKYNVGLINGTPCYSGTKQFKVDNDHVEKGIHEGVKLMKKGQKAIFILPSHLAHGLMGDGNKIPPKAILICELEVKSVKKS